MLSCSLARPFRLLEWWWKDIAGGSRIMGDMARGDEATKGAAEGEMRIYGKNCLAADERGKEAGEMGNGDESSRMSGSRPDD